MSETVKCELCECEGKRRRGYACPDGWLFAEVRDDYDPTKIMVVWACSAQCALGLFEPGPGHLMFADADIESLIADRGPKTEAVRLGPHRPLHVPFDEMLAEMAMWPRLVDCATLLLSCMGPDWSTPLFPNSGCRPLTARFCYSGPFCVNWGVVDKYSVNMTPAVPSALQ